MAKKVETKEVRDAKAKATPKKAVKKPRAKKAKVTLAGGVDDFYLPPVKKGLSKTFKKNMAKNNITNPDDYRKIRNAKKKRLAKK